MCAQGQEIPRRYPGELGSNSGQMGALRNKEGWELVAGRTVALSCNTLNLKVSLDGGEL